MPSPTSSPWWRDSNKPASGKTGSGQGGSVAPRARCCHARLGRGRRSPPYPAPVGPCRAGLQLFGTYRPCPRSRCVTGRHWPLPDDTGRKSRGPTAPAEGGRPCGSSGRHPTDLPGPDLPAPEAGRTRDRGGARAARVRAVDRQHDGVLAGMLLEQEQPVMQRRAAAGGDSGSSARSRHATPPPRVPAPPDGARRRALERAGGRRRAREAPSGPTAPGARGRARRRRRASGRVKRSGGSARERLRARSAGPVSTSPLGAIGGDGQAGRRQGQGGRGRPPAALPRTPSPAHPTPASFPV